jgi:hypothetical protein
MTEENGFSTPPLRVVSLDMELLTLSGAARGAQILVGLQAQKALFGDQERDASSGVFSILALVTERIGQLQRVIRNEENPAHLWAPHNAVEDPATTGEFDGDILLFPWGSHRAPLIMWNCRTTEGTEAPKEQKARGPKARKPEEAAPSGEGQEPKEPEAPTSDEEH